MGGSIGGSRSHLGRLVHPALPRTPNPGRRRKLGQFTFLPPFVQRFNNLHEINVFLSFPQISGFVDERNLKKFFAGFYVEMFCVLMQIPLITNTATL